MKAMLGRKLGMTQIFDEQGRAVPVTVIEAGPCRVVRLKSAGTDGYHAVQLGFGAVKPSKVNRPMQGHFRRAGVDPAKHLVEFRVDPSEELRPGQELKADLFSAGDLVDVTGTSRGKGFAGGIRRWGFKRGPMTHGSKYHRGPGSLQSRDASRVFKGRKLPGRLGGERVTVQALRVVRVDAERNLLLVRGAVPGPEGGLLRVRASVKRTRAAAAKKGK